MKSNTVQATDKGQMPKGKRQVIPVRLLADEHQELQQASLNEGLSMGFIAYRRYQAGLKLELDCLDSK